MRFVMDTNLLVSAVIKPESLPGQVLTIAQRVGKLCFSKETHVEIVEVLTRDKFDRYVPKSERLVKLETIFS